MKNTLVSGLLFILLFSSCSSTKIIATWVNKEFVSKAPYKSIYLIALTSDNASKFQVETKLEELITKNGRKVVRSEFLYTPEVSADRSISKADMAKVVSDSGCDAVFTICLLDVKTEERYQEGSTYAPYGYGFSGTYYGYYEHYTPQVSTQGYYITDKAYYVESNLYDAAADKLIWSIQSATYNPKDFEEWFKDYSRAIMKELKKKGLIKK